MSSNNDNLGGRSSGVQQPKRKRKNHKDICQWSSQHWENILQTNMDHAFSYGALTSYQAQQEPQKVQGSHICDLSLCLSTEITNQHLKMSSAVGAGITYQAEKESVKGLQDSDLSLGLPIEVDISHSIVSSAVLNSALSTQGCAKTDAPLLTGLLPEKPSIGNIEMSATISPANQASHFSSLYDSQFQNLMSSLRKVAETPSIFRKRRRELLSERETRKADTYALGELNIGTGDSSGDPKPNSVSLFPLKPDLQILRGKSFSEHGSPFGVRLHENGLPSVDNNGFSLLLSGCQDEGRIQKDSAIQNPFQQPESLSIVSSEALDPALTDSVHQQSSKMPHASSIKEKEQSLDLDRKSLHSDFRSAFLEKGVEISAFEILSGLGSATPFSLVSPSSSASERGSPSTGVVPSRAPPKKGSPSTHVTPPRDASQKVSPSTLTTPPRAASEKISPSAGATPPRAASEKALPSTAARSSWAGSKKASPSTLNTPPRAASERILPSASATPPRAASEKVLPSIVARSSRAGSKKASSSTFAIPPRAASEKVLPSASASPPTAASQMVSPSIRATRWAHISTPALGTHSQQKRRPSRGRNPLSNQIEGPPSQRKLPSSQNDSPSNQDTKPSASSGRLKSSFKGVSLFKRTGRYEAHFWNSTEKRQEYLGSFSTEEQAARAYDRATLFFRRSEKLHFQLDDYAGELPLLVALTKDQLLSMLKEQGHKEGSQYPAYPG